MLNTNDSFIILDAVCNKLRAPADMNTLFIYKKLILEFFVIKRSAIRNSKHFRKSESNWKFIKCYKIQHIHAFGVVQAVMVMRFSQQFGVHKNTIRSLWKRSQQLDNSVNRPSSGRPRVKSDCKANHFTLVHLRNRFQTATLTARGIPGLRRISAKTVRNRLREHNLDVTLYVQYCFNVIKLQD